ncbi:hypothetical protein LPN04_20640 [Rugamonas sp. A1-17]|nr:hypothetical protein [Rugamonas sp. A1-17]
METAVVADSANEQQQQLLAAYSEGKLERRELEQSTGLCFGEILNRLARWPAAGPKIS